jgi:AcrR family transcriptional regulator
MYHATMFVVGVRGPHAPRDETRARILETAQQLIGEKGFVATSTRELCERMGFTKAALYYHFQTKDELLGVLVGPLLEALGALVDERVVDPSPRARRQVLVAYVDLVADHQGLMRVLAEDPSVRQHEALAPGAAIFRRLTRLLAGQEEPDTATRVQVRAALGSVHAALQRTEPDEDLAALVPVALSAACGALGMPRPAVPAPRHPNDHQK